MSIREEILDLKARMQKEIIGQEEIVERILIGLLANGNLLVEGLPGLAKTRAIKALSNNIEGSYGRVQFTPDLVSADITGKEVVHEDDSGQRTFKFMPGPIFNNIVLADEINRAPSKTQNALLEAMEERQVTVAAVAHKVPDLFMVMATQNPSKQEGTFPLPEAQLDRFLMHVYVDYPDEETEVNIIRLVRGEQQRESKEKLENKAPKEKKLTPQEAIFRARAEIDKVRIPAYIERYIVDLIFATRYPGRYGHELKTYLKVGVSPRGTIAMDKATRTYAWLNGRNEVELDDVYAMIKPVLRHRLGLGKRAEEHNVNPEELIDDIIELVEISETGNQSAKTISSSV